MTDDQVLRLECLRICVSVAEAKNAYFWINGEGRQMQSGLNQANAYNNSAAASLASGLNQASQYRSSGQSV